MTQEPGDNSVEIAPGLSIPEALLSFTFARSSGPGGQNVNKLNTKAQLSVTLDDLADHMPPSVIKRLADLAGNKVTDDGRLLIETDEHRSQRRNRDECVLKLRELIVRARVVPKRRKKTRPSRASKERRLKAKKERGEIKRLRKDPKSGP